jgi:hypothetical protein
VNHQRLVVGVLKRQRATFLRRGIEQIPHRDLDRVEMRADWSAVVHRLAGKVGDLPVRPLGVRLKRLLLGLLPRREFLLERREAMRG